jgi:uncharacterized repeat protein (TIGR03803 family)
MSFWQYRHTEEVMSFTRELWILRVLVVVTTVMWVSALGASAESKYKTVYRIAGEPYGGTPTAGLIFGHTGNLYGTTYLGGHLALCGGTGCGTVFELTPNADGSLKRNILYKFCSIKNCGDGIGPAASVISDTDGNLYGTTIGGGAHRRGVVFRLTPNQNGSWSEKVLHSFEGRDGQEPIASLAFDRAGNLYGTTLGGGDSGNGVVFQLAPSMDGGWKEVVLYSFAGGTGDGSGPSASLVFDEAENLYGTTQTGGWCKESSAGCGTVFELTPNIDGSWKEEVLYFFGENGFYPVASVVIDPSGNIYGTTPVSSHGAGVVYQLARKTDGSWKENVLHTFCPHETDCIGGGNPFAGLIFDSAGNLYGTATFGGNYKEFVYGCGVIFKLAPNSKGGWHKKVMHTFYDRPGCGPNEALIFDVTGNLYGTTQGDGITTFGSVFEVTP